MSDPYALLYFGVLREIYLFLADTGGAEGLEAKIILALNAQEPGDDYGLTLDLLELVLARSDNIDDAATEMQLRFLFEFRGEINIKRAQRKKQIKGGKKKTYPYLDGLIKTSIGGILGSVSYIALTEEEQKLMRRDIKKQAIALIRQHREITKTSKESNFPSDQLIRVRIQELLGQ